jgi:hypothetical protein
LDAVDAVKGGASIADLRLECIDKVVDDALTTVNQLAYNGQCRVDVAVCWYVKHQDFGHNSCAPFWPTREVIFEAQQNFMLLTMLRRTI